MTALATLASILVTTTTTLSGHTDSLQQAAGDTGHHELSRAAAQNSTQRGEPGGAGEPPSQAQPAYPLVHAVQPALTPTPAALKGDAGGSIQLVVACNAPVYPHVAAPGAVAQTPCANSQTMPIATAAAMELDRPAGSMPATAESTAAPAPEHESRAGDVVKVRPLCCESISLAM